MLTCFITSNCTPTHGWVCGVGWMGGSMGGVRCSRYFRHCVQQFIKFIIMGKYSPFGQVLDFVHRVEFQKRGSPHIHGLLWIHNAPKFGTSPDEDVCKLMSILVFHVVLM